MMPGLFGDTKENAVYMLCSDGFRHEITPQEIFEKFQPAALLDNNMMSPIPKSAA